MQNVNSQVEMHPYAPQKELRAYCAEHGILVQAYASLGGQDASKGTLEPLGGHLMRRPVVCNDGDNESEPRTLFVAPLPPPRTYTLTHSRAHFATYAHLY
jgi:hypothetical protein